LLSLIVYNSMLFIGLRDRRYLYYSIYLSLFNLLNFAYSGHGFAWVWPDNPRQQNHIILVCIVLFGSSGLTFASGFLDLAQNAPKALRPLKVLAAIGIGALLVSLLLGQQSRRWWRGHRERRPAGFDHPQAGPCGRALLPSRDPLRHGRRGDHHAYRVGRLAIY
jgi:hypothetical protein